MPTPWATWQLLWSPASVHALAMQLAVMQVHLTAPRPAGTTTHATKNSTAIDDFKRGVAP